MFLTPDNIRISHGLTINQKIIPWGATWNKDWGNYKKGDKYKADKMMSNGTGRVEYITIHNSEDIIQAIGTTDSEQYTRATWPNCNMKDARVHYFIDYEDCWQNLKDNEVGWHCGNSVGNDTSIAIEIIMKGDNSENDKIAEERGALLAAILLDKYNLGIDRLVTHKFWSGKECPLYILNHWDSFVDKVSSQLEKIREISEEEHKIYRVQVGAFRVKANAEKCVEKLKKAGFENVFIR